MVKSSTADILLHALDGNYMLNSDQLQEVRPWHEATEVKEDYSERDTAVYDMVDNVSLFRNQKHAIHSIVMEFHIFMMVRFCLQSK